MASVALALALAISVSNRMDCDSIKGTEYLSYEEREWYLDNCVYRAIADDAILAKIRDCESGGDYAINTGNGFYGAYQFLQSTFDGAIERAGYPKYAGIRPDLIPPEIQDLAASQLYAETGGTPWPICAFN